MVKGFPGSSAGKESTCHVGNPGSIPRPERFPWKKDRLTTPVFLPGEAPWTGVWQATVHEVTRVRCDLVTKQQQ